MNDYLLSVLLGVIEGLTEFLPVSSTAHLRIAEALLGVDLGNGYWKTYSIAIQLGAILCLPLYFRSRIVAWLRTFPGGPQGRNTLWNHPLSLTLYAFVCTVIPALLLTKLIGKHLENIVLMAYALTIGGVIMWVVDAVYGAAQPSAKTLAARAESVDEVTLLQALWVGCCQALSAVFPGTSRSMCTIAAGQVAGLSRPAALEFSFLLSIPTMVAATGYEILRSLRPGHAGSALGVGPRTAHEWIVLAIGFAVSFLVAYAVVAWFVGWVRKRGFVPFAIYRIVLGLCVGWWAIQRAGA